MTEVNKNFRVKNGLEVGGSGVFDGTVVVATPTENNHAATKLYVDQNAGGGGSAITVSDTAPTSPIPSEGDIWFDSSTGRKFIYYDNFWVESGTSSAFPEVTSPLSYNAETNTVSIDLSAKQDVVAGVSDTEIGYLDGVTSSIQTQLNGKVNSLQPLVVKTSSFTVSPSDNNSLHACTTTMTVTLPTTGMSEGMRFDFVNTGTGVVTFTGATIYSKGSAVTLDTQFAAATFYYNTATSGFLIGDLA